MEQKHTTATWRIKSPKALGAALRDARKQAGLSQGDLADKLGTTRHRISRLERGDISDQLYLILGILDQLHMEILLKRQ